MTRSKRPELSSLNVLFCIIIIFINAFAYGVATLKPGTVSYTLVAIPWRLSAFAVQGYLLLSGIKTFLNGREHIPYFKYIARRIIDIIIPYTICFVVYYIFYIVAHRYPLDILFILKSYFTGSLAPYLYLVPLIFQFDLLMPLWKRIVNKCSPLVIIPFVLLFSMICADYLPRIIGTAIPGFNFAHNDKLFTSYLFYWLAGCYIGKHYDSFCDTTQKNFTPICIIYGITVTLNILFSCLAYNSIAFVPYLNHIHSIYIMYTCLFLLAVFLKFSDKIYNKAPLIATVDKISLYIWLYHMLIILIIEKLITLI